MPIDPGLQEEILSHLVAAIERTPLERSPFAHINFSDAFPPAVYAAMLATLPPADLYYPANQQKYGLPDGRCSRTVLDLAPMLDRLPSNTRTLWTTVQSALADDSLRAVTCQRLGVANRGLPVTRLIHDLPGYWIEPHPDSRIKHVTMQFYLAADDTHAELGTILYRLRPFSPAVWLGRAPMMQRVKQFAFRPNTGYAFGVRWNSFHGIETIKASSGDRHTVLHTYYRRPPSR